MKRYICPMHPQIRQDKPGRCPICKMKLVPETKVESGQSKTESTWKDYVPLIVVVSLILVTTLAISLTDLQTGLFSVSRSISYFMIGFFLVFSSFKLMDMEGFAQGYATYDLLAQKWFTYGYIYPFIELFFGLAMIVLPHSPALLWTELIVMAFSGLGVAIKLAKGEKFQCACLGTFLKVPLTKVTLIEDFGMALLAGLLLWLK